MKISVALCTFNGARFLDEQLASIAAQTRQPDELVVCDDASSDGTRDILDRFAISASFPVRIIVNDSNRGVITNFRQAIALCTGELTALADQDDVWLPDKLERAEAALMSSINIGTTLYCTKLQYVDSRLKPLGLSITPHNTGFSNAVVENSATGCSVVFGREIKKRFLEAQPADMVMHDWWLYLLATAFGSVIYDSQHGLLYRQHDSNAAGWQPRPSKLWNRMHLLRRRLLAGREGMDSLNQALRFVNSYPDIDGKKREIVDELVKLRQAGFARRLNYLRSPKVARNDALENLGLKIMILMGWH